MVFLNQADKDAFVAGWMHRHLVNSIQIGDMFSRGQGDLNLDGITNIQDLLIIQNALSGAGMGTISAQDLLGVPEPATITLLLVMMTSVPIRFRRASR